MKPAKKHHSLKLAQDQPVERITVTQICKLAKVNRTTFYANYLDIYDLKDQVRERMMAEYVSLRSARSFTRKLSAAVSKYSGQSDVL